MLRLRRRKPPPEPSHLLTRQFALCPFPRCDRLVDSWETVVEYRDVPEREPAWPGGPLIDVPGMIARREPVRSTATFGPCGHAITWRPGEDGFTLHTIEVPGDTGHHRALARLLMIRDGSPDPG